MEPVAQEDTLGCAVACVAFVLHIPYSQAIDLFIDGRKRVKKEANFYCPEIVTILHSNGLRYKWRKLPEYIREEDIEDRSIVFVEKSHKLPFGHFLSKYNTLWMDPWENVPNTPITAGFRSVLPGKPTYQIYPYYH